MRLEQGQGQGQEQELGDDIPDNYDRVGQGRLSIISIEVGEARTPDHREGDGLPSYIEACSMDISTEYQ